MPLPYVLIYAKLAYLETIMNVKVAQSLLFELLNKEKASIPSLSRKIGISHQTLYRLKNGSRISQRTFNLLFRFTTIMD